MLAEREACTTLDGQFDTLATKLKLQYKETIKSQQFRKLVWLESENIEEWMGRLCVAAVECNYREVDRQLKEQFIHGLNDKCMLEEIIKELTITRDDDWITSESVLAWEKRVEAQRTQAASVKHHYGIKADQGGEGGEKAKGREHKMSTRSDSTVVPMQILWWDTCAKAVSSTWQDVHGLWQNWTLQKDVPKQKR